jgi:hypothetical protein
MHWRAEGETHCPRCGLGDGRAATFRYLGLGPGHQLGVSWHTVWDAVKSEATGRISATGRLAGADELGVDEHVWSHTGRPGTGMVTGIVDHTRDQNGVMHALLLDLVPRRSGKAYADWLKTRGPVFTAGIRTAALDPFCGYANAIRDELREAITAWTLFTSSNSDRPWLTRSGAGSSRTRPRTPRPNGRPALRDPQDPADRT